MHMHVSSLGLGEVFEAGEMHDNDLEGETVGEVFEDELEGKPVGESVMIDSLEDIELTVVVNGELGDVCEEGVVVGGG